MNAPQLTTFCQQVLITGKALGHLGNLEVEFDWPRVVSNGKWLLYLTEIQVDGTSEARCDPPGDIVNPLHLMVTIETADLHDPLTCPRVMSFLSTLPQLSPEEELRQSGRSLGEGLKKGVRRRSLEEELKGRGRSLEEKKEPNEKSPPVLHLQGQRKTSYTLVQLSVI